MNKKLILVGLMGLILGGIVPAANGQCWGVGFPYAPAYWGNCYSNSYVRESVPYFALHPPVYYSYHIARTYGNSPFAYPPGVFTPSSEFAYASGMQNNNPAPQQSPEPLRIDNPFVDQWVPDVTKGPKPNIWRPQIVYPAALARQSG